MKTEKTFDCIAMKRNAASRIHEETKDMTREKKLAYWRAKRESLRRKYPYLYHEGNGPAAD